MLIFYNANVKLFVPCICNAFQLYLLLSALSVKMLSPLLKEKGALYVRNNDKDGWPLLVFAVKKHVKGLESPDLMKQYFLYYLERMDR